MRDELLFVVAPRLAAFCCVAAVVLSNLTGRRPNRTLADRNGSGDLLARACRYSIAAILVGHVVAFAFPAAVLLWDRSLVRLIVLESVGLAAAVVALVSLVLIIVRHVARHR